MNFIFKLSSNCPRILRLAGVGIACVGILVLLWQAIPVIDSYTYAQAYAYGNVSQGYMSQAEGVRFLDREFQWAIRELWPLAVQAVGVLAAAGLLYVAARRTEQPNGRR